MERNGNIDSDDWSTVTKIFPANQITILMLQLINRLIPLKIDTIEK